jgi:hypothetical protein
MTHNVWKKLDDAFTGSGTHWSHYTDVISQMFARTVAQMNVTVEQKVTYMKAFVIFWVSEHCSSLGIPNRTRRFENCIYSHSQWKSREALFCFYNSTMGTFCKGCRSILNLGYIVRHEVHKLTFYIQNKL